jgi:hypothetical protein
MASSGAGSYSDEFIPVRTYEAYVNAVPPRTIEDPVARIQRAVTTVVAKTLRRE